MSIYKPYQCNCFKHKTYGISDGECNCKEARLGRMTEKIDSENNQMQEKYTNY